MMCETPSPDSPLFVYQLAATRSGVMMCGSYLYFGKSGWIVVWDNGTGNPVGTP